MDEILIDGDKIKRLRQARHWSQADLARTSGVDQGTISRLENNVQEKTRIETLVALARTFGIAADDLFMTPTAGAADALNPRVNVMTHLIEDMTEEERDSLELFARFILAQRDKSWRKERLKEREARAKKEK